MKTALRTIRWILDATLLSLVAGVVALVLVAGLGPSLGHQPIIIRGGSMTPAIPLGALVDVTSVQPADLEVGDVVTIKGPNGVLVTHRIAAIVNGPDGLYLQMKGDANATPDAAQVPVSAVTGRVGLVLPWLGYLLYMITTPLGLASIFGLGLSLLLATWLVEDLEESFREDRPDPSGTARRIDELIR
jgi:signal peptidase